MFGKSDPREDSTNERNNILKAIAKNTTFDNPDENFAQFFYCSEGLGRFFGGIEPNGFFRWGMVENLIKGGEGKEKMKKREPGASNRGLPDDSDQRGCTE